MRKGEASSSEGLRKGCWETSFALWREREREKKKGAKTPSSKFQGFFSIVVIFHCLHRL